MTRMLRIRTLLGIVGTAAALTVIGQPLAQRSLQTFVGAAVAGTDAAHSERAAKADRLTMRAVHPATAVVPVSVEIVGSTPLNLVMRARDGSVLYHVDGATGTTSVARDGDLPAVTIRTGSDAPSVTAPSAQQTPPAPAPLPSRIIRVGCEGAVSALVSPEARRMLPGRCLV
jgi:hypothetical protein